MDAPSALPPAAATTAAAVAEPHATVPAAVDFDAVVALGSNIGDTVGTLARAIDLLTGDARVTLVARSRDYRTAPWGNTDQDWFLNAAIAVRTTLDPHALLARCLEVERQLGRVRTVKWGPRVIDLDLIVYRDREIDTPDLVLPHPHLTARAFVLRPMADIAPDLVVRGRTVRDWLAELGA
jgi:2-amino-4-hydroxy-6-hydroxymethyldihydropteridine diphosphokinase